MVQEIIDTVEHRPTMGVKVSQIVRYELIDRWIDR